MKFTFRDPILLISIVCVMIVVLLFILIPLITILKESLLDGGRLSAIHYSRAITSPFTRDIVWNTLKLGLSVSVLGTVVAFIFAYAITNLKLPSKRMFKVLSILPMISPPFVISLAAILLFGRSGLITRGLLGIRSDIYGFWGLMLTQTLSFFPIGFLMLTNLLQNIDPSVEEA
ncbi:MAG: iron ABC transporter permease, partial [Sphaerochaetaceae bacterium]